MELVFSLEQEQSISLHQEVHGLVKAYIKDSRDVNNDACNHILWQLFGKNAHMATDEIYYLREFVQELFVFLATPDINKRFAEQASVHTVKFPEMLRSLTEFLYSMNNPLALAEIAEAHLKYYHMDDEPLQRMKQEYSELLQIDEIKKAA